MPVKLTTTAEGERKRKRKKTSKRIYRTSQSIINVFLESLLSFPSLGLTVHLSSLGALQHRAGLWVCCGGSSGSHLVLPLCALASSVPSCQNRCVSLVGALSACVSPTDSASARRIMWVQSAARTAGGKVGVFLLSPAAPGFQLWFYFHLYMWFVHWGLLLRLPWRAWVCPWEGQLWRWCSCLGRRGSGRTRYSGELVARAAGNRVL